MNKLLLCTALILMSAQAKLFAQDNNDIHTVKSKTHRVFCGSEMKMYILNYVYLRNGEMSIALQGNESYKYLKNLTAALIDFRKAIAFYNDSLVGNTGSVTIDFVADEDHGYKKLRIKRHPADGDLFLTKTGEVSRLKVEGDTVKILFHTIESANPDWGPYYDATVSFNLDNYTDIDKIIADSMILKHTIDTLITVAEHTKAKRYTVGYCPGETRYPAYQFWKFRKVNYRATEKDLVKGTDQLVINGGVGVGLVKNTLSPMGDIGIEIDKQWRGLPTAGPSFLRLSTTPYFFFDKDVKNNTIVNDNWFVNLEFGYYERKGKNRFSMGVGYLYAERGNVFQKQTYKAFINMQFGKITVVPEFICNDNFKQIYPGITLKLMNLGN